MNFNENDIIPTVIAMAHPVIRVGNTLLIANPISSENCRMVTWNDSVFQYFSAYIGLICKRLQKKLYKRSSSKDPIKFDEKKVHQAIFEKYKIDLISKQHLDEVSSVCAEFYTALARIKAGKMPANHVDSWRLIVEVLKVNAQLTMDWEEIVESLFVKESLPQIDLFR